jgi:uncharacterized RDD family membrane protein YckC
MWQRMAQIDYYLVLGVDERADDAEIREAYRRLARKYHPDVNPDDVRAAMRFKLISDAYRVLSNPTRRAAYAAPLPAEPVTTTHAQPPRRTAPTTWTPPRAEATSAPSLAATLAHFREVLLNASNAWTQQRSRGGSTWRHASPRKSTAYGGNPGLQTPAGAQLAGLGHRLAASVIDMAALSISLVLFIFIINSIGSIFGLGADASSNSDFNDFLVLVLFFSPIYFITLWTLYGRTLGCAVTDLRLRQMNGDTLTIRVAALRWLCGLLSSIPLFLGFLWLLRDHDGLAWHDRLSGSIVLQESREQADFRTT